MSDTSKDFSWTNYGSVCILNALSDEAKAWVEENLPADAQKWSACGTAIEPRCIPAILDGIEESGLTIEN